MLLHRLSLVRDELYLFIQAQSIELCRVKGVLGFRQKLIHQKTIHLGKETIVTSPDDWQDVVNRLQTLLKDDKWQASSATVILSSHFMRYAVIPWNSQITTAEERQAYLNHHFVMTYGDVVKNWNMRMDTPMYKKSALASAMPEALRVALSDIFAQINTRLVAISPYLMLAANQALKVNRFIHDCWFVVIEEQRLNISLIEQGEWQVVRNAPLEADIAAQIEVLIQRGILLESANTKKAENRESYPVLIHWPKVDDVKTIEIKHHRVVNMVSNQYPESQQTGVQQHMHWAIR